jgi:hypothetical protein
MKTIIIEDSVYSVTDKEFNKINLMQKKMDAEKNLQIRFGLEIDLSDYLTEQRKFYKCYGDISFQFRL